MQITILAMGSRGDVQPYVALGSGLKSAGHSVQMLSTLDFQPLVAAHGLEFAAIGDSAIAQAQAHMKDLAEQGNLLQILSATGQGARQLAEQTARSGLQASQGSDLIIGGLGFMGLALAEKLGTAYVPAYLVPLTPTRTFPSALAPLPQSKLTRWANRLSHTLTQQMMWRMMFRSADTYARTEVLDLPPLPRPGPFKLLEQQDAPLLYGYSPAVLPPPSDWSANIHVTGYWFLDAPAGWQPPQALAEFLAAGPPPVYIGFGSMFSRDPQANTALMIAALQRTGQRGILYGGWGGLAQSDLPDNVLMIDAVPHSWLFPHMAAVVHHGGAGTTAAGLRAGVPSIIVPFFGDQPFWGRRVQALGVGPQAIPRRQLSAAKLAAAIDQALSDSRMQQRAAALGARIRAEDGIGRAVEVIQQWAHNQRR